MDERRTDRIKQKPARNFSSLKKDNQVKIWSTSLDLLERKIDSLVSKLRRNNISLEVFSSDAVEFGSVLGQDERKIVKSCTILYNNLQVNARAVILTDNREQSLDETLKETELMCLAADAVVCTTARVYGVLAAPEKPQSFQGMLVIIQEVEIMKLRELYERDLIPLAVTYDVWSRLAASLHCIHSRGVVLVEVNAENICVTELVRNTVGEIAEVDVKFSSLTKAQHLLVNRPHHRDFHPASHIDSDQHPDVRSDVFALGITFCTMLLNQCAVKKGSVTSVIQRIEESVKRGVVGQQLFDSVIQPNIPLSEMSYTVESMIRAMLEPVSGHGISLLEVIRICRSESAEHSADDSSDFKDFPKLDTSAFLTERKRKPCPVKHGRERKRSVSAVSDSVVTHQQKGTSLGRMSHGRTSHSRSSHDRTSHTRTSPWRRREASLDDERDTCRETIEPVCRRTRSARHVTSYLC